MRAEVIPFQFHSRQVRVVPSDNGLTFWVVAKDVTDALGYRMASDALRRVPAEHKGTHLVRTLGGDQQMLCVDEPGLYRLILRSDKPEAEPFMEWVTAEVLPTIRRTGGYQHGQPTPPPSAHEVPVEELLELYRIKAAYYEQQATGKKPKRPAPRPLTDDEREMIVLLRQQGLTPMAIAKRVGRSKSSVRNVLISQGLK